MFESELSLGSWLYFNYSKECPKFTSFLKLLSRLVHLETYCCRVKCSLWLLWILNVRPFCSLHVTNLWNYEMSLVISSVKIIKIIISRFELFKQLPMISLCSKIVGKTTNEWMTNRISIADEITMSRIIKYQRHSDKR